MRKKGKILVIGLVFVIVASFFLFVACNKTAPIEKSARDFVSMDKRPDAPAIVVDGSTPEEKIYNLYMIALNNLKTTPYLAAHNEGLFENTTAGMTNYLYDDYIILKTPDRYFYCNYRSIKDCPIADSAIFASIFKEMGAILSERRYYEKGEEQAYFQMNNDNIMNEQNLPTTEWDSLEMQEMDPIVFNADDAGSFVINEHDFQLDFIIDDDEFPITFEEKEDEDGNKYYSMTFALDPDQATTISEKKIKEQTGDENTKYNRLTYAITIWDNGYFRTYDNDSYFAGKALGVFSAKYKDEYYWHFSYDQQDCNIDAYVDAAGIRDVYKS